MTVLGERISKTEMHVGQAVPQREGKKSSEDMLSIALYSVRSDWQQLSVGRSDMQNQNLHFNKVPRGICLSSDLQVVGPKLGCFFVLPVGLRKKAEAGSLF